MGDGYIDITVNARFSADIASRFANVGWYKFVDKSVQKGRGMTVEKLGAQQRSFREGISEGYNLDSMIGDMDKAGVEKAILIAVQISEGIYGKDIMVNTEEVSKFIERFPDRLLGQVGISSRKPIMETVRYINKAVRDYQFVAVHCYPHWFGIPINDKKFYPIYSKCVELDIPFCFQAGLRTPRSGAKWVQDPMLMDEIAVEFPELRIVALHTGGSNFAGQTQLLARDHENFFIGADVPRPNMWSLLPSELPSRNFLEFCHNFPDKVMWGTDYPVISQSESIKQVDELKFPEEVKKMILRDNARRVYKIS